MKVHRVSNALLSLAYPSACRGCDAALDPSSGDHFCGTCLAEFFDSPHGRCPRCAASLAPGLAPAKRCLSCRETFQHIEGSVCVADFTGKLMELVHAFKYGRQRSLGRSLSGLLAQVVRQAPWRRRIDAVVAVPLTWRKFVKRGFNQSEVLATAAAKALGKPCAFRALRHRARMPQVGLSKRRRIENVRDTFTAPRARSLVGRRVLLVDDVATTGATLSECARVLKRDVGAAGIYAAVLARTGSGAGDAPTPTADRSTHE